MPHTLCGFYLSYFFYLLYLQFLLAAENLGNTAVYTSEKYFLISSESSGIYQTSMSTIQFPILAFLCFIFFLFPLLP